MNINFRRFDGLDPLRDADLQMHGDGKGALKITGRELMQLLDSPPSGSVGRDAVLLLSHTRLLAQQRTRTLADLERARARMMGIAAASAVASRNLIQSQRAQFNEIMLANNNNTNTIVNASTTSTAADGISSRPPSASAIIANASSSNLGTNQNTNNPMANNGLSEHLALKATVIAKETSEHHQRLTEVLRRDMRDAVQQCQKLYDTFAQVDEELEAARARLLTLYDRFHIVAAANVENDDQAREAAEIAMMAAQVDAMGAAAGGSIVVVGGGGGGGGVPNGNNASKQQVADISAIAPAPDDDVDGEGSSGKGTTSAAADATQAQKSSASTAAPAVVSKAHRQVRNFCRSTRFLHWGPEEHARALGVSAVDDVAFLGNDGVGGSSGGRGGDGAHSKHGGANNDSHAAGSKLRRSTTDKSQQQQRQQSVVRSTFPANMSMYHIAQMLIRNVLMSLRTRAEMERITKEQQQQQQQQLANASADDSSAAGPLSSAVVRSEEVLTAQLRGLQLEFQHQTTKLTQLFAAPEAQRIVFLAILIQKNIRRNNAMRQLRALATWRQHVDDSRVVKAFKTWRRRLEAERMHRRNRMKRIWKILVANANATYLCRAKFLDLIHSARARATIRRVFLMWHRYSVYMNSPVDEYTHLRVIRKFDEDEEEDQKDNSRRRSAANSMTPPRPPSMSSAAALLDKRANSLFAGATGYGQMDLGGDRGDQMVLSMSRPSSAFAAVAAGGGGEGGAAADGRSHSLGSSSAVAAASAAGGDGGKRMSVTQLRRNQRNESLRAQFGVKTAAMVRRKSSSIAAGTVVPKSNSFDGDANDKDIDGDDDGRGSGKRLSTASTASQNSLAASNNSQTAAGGKQQAPQLPSRGSTSNNTALANDSMGKAPMGFSTSATAAASQGGSQRAANASVKLLLDETQAESCENSPSKKEGSPLLSHSTLAMANNKAPAAAVNMSATLEDVALENRHIAQNTSTTRLLLLRNDSAKISRWRAPSVEEIYSRKFRLEAWDQFVAEDFRRVKLMRSGVLCGTDPLLNQAYYLNRWRKYIDYRRQKRRKTAMAQRHYELAFMGRHFFAWLNLQSFDAQTRASNKALKNVSFTVWKRYVYRSRRDLERTQAIRGMRALKLLQLWRYKTIHYRRHLAAANLTLTLNRPRLLYPMLCMLTAGDAVHALQGLRGPSVHTLSIAQQHDVSATSPSLASIVGPIAGSSTATTAGASSLAAASANHGLKGPQLLGAISAQVARMYGTATANSDGDAHNSNNNGVLVGDTQSGSDVDRALVQAALDARKAKHISNGSATGLHSAEAIILGTANGGGCEEVSLIHQLSSNGDSNFLHIPTAAESLQYQSYLTERVFLWCWGEWKQYTHRRAIFKAFVAARWARRVKRIRAGVVSAWRYFVLISKLEARGKRSEDAIPTANDTKRMAALFAPEPPGQLLQEVNLLESKRKRALLVRKFVMLQQKEEALGGGGCFRLSDEERAVATGIEITSADQQQPPASGGDGKGKQFGARRTSAVSSAASAAAVAAGMTASRLLGFNPLQLFAEIVGPVNASMSNEYAHDMADNRAIFRHWLKTMRRAGYDANKGRDEAGAAEDSIITNDHQMMKAILQMLVLNVRRENHKRRDAEAAWQLQHQQQAYASPLNGAAVGSNYNGSISLAQAQQGQHDAQQRSSTVSSALGGGGTSAYSNNAESRRVSGQSTGFTTVGVMAANPSRRMSGQSLIMGVGGGGAATAHDAPLSMMQEGGGVGGVGGRSSSGATTPVALLDRTVAMNAATAQAQQAAAVAMAQQLQQEREQRLDLKIRQNMLLVMMIGYPLYKSLPNEVTIGKIENFASEIAKTFGVRDCGRRKRDKKILRKFLTRLHAHKFANASDFFTAIPLSQHSIGFSPFQMLIDRYNTLMSKNDASRTKGSSSKGNNKNAAKNKFTTTFANQNKVSDNNADSEAVASTASGPSLANAAALRIAPKNVKADGRQYKKYPIPLPQVPRKRQLIYLLRLHLDGIVSSRKSQANIANNRYLFVKGQLAITWSYLVLMTIQQASARNMPTGGVDGGWLFHHTTASATAAAGRGGGGLTSPTISISVGGGGPVGITAPSLLLNNNDMMNSPAGSVSRPSFGLGGGGGGMGGGISFDIGGLRQSHMLTVGGGGSVSPSMSIMSLGARGTGFGGGGGGSLSPQSLALATAASAAPPPQQHTAHAAVNLGMIGFGSGGQMGMLTQQQKEVIENAEAHRTKLLKLLRATEDSAVNDFTLQKKLRGVGMSIIQRLWEAKGGIGKAPANYAYDDFYALASGFAPPPPPITAVGRRQSLQSNSAAGGGGERRGSQISTAAAASTAVVVFVNYRDDIAGAPLSYTQGGGAATVPITSPSTAAIASASDNGAAIAAIDNKKKEGQNTTGRRASTPLIASNLQGVSSQMTPLSPSLALPSPSNNNLATTSPLMVGFIPTTAAPPTPLSTNDALNGSNSNNTPAAAITTTTSRANSTTARSSSRLYRRGADGQLITHTNCFYGHYPEDSFDILDRIGFNPYYLKRGVSTSKSRQMSQARNIHRIQRLLAIVLQLDRIHEREPYVVVLEHNKPVRGSSYHLLKYTEKKNAQRQQQLQQQQHQQPSSASTSPSKQAAAAARRSNTNSKNNFLSDLADIQVVDERDDPNGASFAFARQEEEDEEEAARNRPKVHEVQMKWGGLVMNAWGGPTVYESSAAGRRRARSNSNSMSMASSDDEASVRARSRSPNNTVPAPRFYNNNKNKQNNADMTEQKSAHLRATRLSRSGSMFTTAGDVQRAGVSQEMPMQLATLMAANPSRFEVEVRYRRRRWSAHTLHEMIGRHERIARRSGGISQTSAEAAIAATLVATGLESSNSRAIIKTGLDRPLSAMISTDIAPYGASATTAGGGMKKNENGSGENDAVNDSAKTTTRNTPATPSLATLLGGDSGGGAAASAECDRRLSTASEQANNRYQQFMLMDADTDILSPSANEELRVAHRLRRIAFSSGISNAMNLSLQLIVRDTESRLVKKSQMEKKAGEGAYNRDDDDDEEREMTTARLQRKREEEEEAAIDPVERRRIQAEIMFQMEGEQRAARSAAMKKKKADASASLAHTPNAKQKASDLNVSHESNSVDTPPRDDPSTPQTPDNNKTQGTDSGLSLSPQQRIDSVETTPPPSKVMRRNGKIVTSTPKTTREAVALANTIASKSAAASLAAARRAQMLNNSHSTSRRSSSAANAAMPTAAAILLKKTGGGGGRRASATPPQTPLSLRQSLNLATQSGNNRLSTTNTAADKQQVVISVKHQNSRGVIEECFAVRNPITGLFVGDEPALVEILRRRLVTWRRRCPRNARANSCPAVCYQPPADDDGNGGDEDMFASYFVSKIKRGGGAKRAYMGSMTSLKATAQSNSADAHRQKLLNEMLGTQSKNEKKNAGSAFLLDEDGEESGKPKGRRGKLNLFDDPSSALQLSEFQFGDDLDDSPRADGGASSTTTGQAANEDSPSVSGSNSVREAKLSEKQERLRRMFAGEDAKASLTAEEALEAERQRKRQQSLDGEAQRLKDQKALADRLADEAENTIKSQLERERELEPKRAAEFELEEQRRKSQDFGLQPPQRHSSATAGRTTRPPTANNTTSVTAPQLVDAVAVKAGVSNGSFSSSKDVLFGTRRPSMKELREAMLSSALETSRRTSSSADPLSFRSPTPITAGGTTDPMLLSIESAATPRDLDSTDRGQRATRPSTAASAGGGSNTKLPTSSSSLLNNDDDPPLLTGPTIIPSDEDEALDEESDDEDDDDEDEDSSSAVLKVSESMLLREMEMMKVKEEGVRNRQAQEDDQEAEIREAAEEEERQQQKKLADAANLAAKRARIAAAKQHRRSTSAAVSVISSSSVSLKTTSMRSNDRRKGSLQREEDSHKRADDNDEDAEGGGEHSHRHHHHHHHHGEEDGNSSGGRVVFPPSLAGKKASSKAGGPITAASRYMEKTASSDSRREGSNSTKTTRRSGSSSRALFAGEVRTKDPHAPQTADFNSSSTLSLTTAAFVTPDRLWADLDAGKLSARATERLLEIATRRGAVLDANAKMHLGALKGQLEELLAEMRTIELLRTEQEAEAEDKAYQALMAGQGLLTAEEEETKSSSRPASPSSLLLTANNDPTGMATTPSMLQNRSQSHAKSINTVEPIVEGIQFRNDGKDGQHRRIRKGTVMVEGLAQPLYFTEAELLMNQRREEADARALAGGSVIENSKYQPPPKITSSPPHSLAQREHLHASAVHIASSYAVSPNKKLVAEAMERRRKWAEAMEKSNINATTRPPTSTASTAQDAIGINYHRKASVAAHVTNKTMLQSGTDRQLSPRTMALNGGGGGGGAASSVNRYLVSDYDLRKRCEKAAEILSLLPDYLRDELQGMAEEEAKAKKMIRLAKGVGKECLKSDSPNAKTKTAADKTLAKQKRLAAMQKESVFSPEVEFVIVNAEPSFESLQLAARELGGAGGGGDDRSLRVGSPLYHQHSALSMNTTTALSSPTQHDATFARRRSSALSSTPPPPEEGIYSILPPLNSSSVSSSAAASSPAFALNPDAGRRLEAKSKHLEHLERQLGEDLAQVLTSAMDDDEDEDDDGNLNQTNRSNASFASEETTSQTNSPFAESICFSGETSPRFEGLGGPLDIPPASSSNTKKTPPKKKKKKQVKEGKQQNILTSKAPLADFRSATDLEKAAQIHKLMQETAALMHATLDRHEANRRRGSATAASTTAAADKDASSSAAPPDFSGGVVRPHSKTHGGGDVDKLPPIPALTGLGSNFSLPEGMLLTSTSPQPAEETPEEPLRTLISSNTGPSRPSSRLFTPSASSSQNRRGRQLNADVPVGFLSNAAISRAASASGRQSSNGGDGNSGAGNADPTTSKSKTKPEPKPRIPLIQRSLSASATQQQHQQRLAAGVISVSSTSVTLGMPSLRQTLASNGSSIGNRPSSSTASIAVGGMGGGRLGNKLRLHQEHATAASLVSASFKSNPTYLSELTDEERATLVEAETDFQAWKAPVERNIRTRSGHAAAAEEARTQLEALRRRRQQLNQHRDNKMCCRMATVIGRQQDDVVALLETPCPEADELFTIHQRRLPPSSALALRPPSGGSSATVAQPRLSNSMNTNNTVNGGAPSRNSFSRPLTAPLFNNNDDDEAFFTAQSHLRGAIAIHPSPPRESNKK